MATILLASTRVAYVAFLITERPVIVYIRTEAPVEVTEEDVGMIIGDIMTQLRRSGVPIAEPMEDSLLDEVPHPHHSIVGTVHEIIFKINRGEI